MGKLTFAAALSRMRVPANRFCLERRLVVSTQIQAVGDKNARGHLARPAPHVSGNGAWC